MLTLRQLQEGKLMSATKLKVFMQEFPWVHKFIGPTEQAYVTRVEPSLLTFVPWTGGVDRDYSHRMNERIYLLDKNGELVTTSFEKLTTRRKYLLFGRKITSVKTVEITGKVQRKTTVSATLEALGKAAKRVCFILAYDKYKRAVILYKSPKGMSVGEWFEQQMEMERTALRQD